MSRRDLELANEAYRATNAQPPDFATINRLFHPDHVFASLVSGVGQGELEGAAGYREFLKEAEETMRWETQIEGAVDLGEGKVLLVTAIEWRTPSSETTLETRAWMIATLQGDKIIRTEVHPDPSQALEAAGLRG